MNQIDPKFTSVKLDLIKRVSPAPNVSKTIDYVKEALNIESSILFHIPDLDNKEIQFHFRQLDYLPFNDFMFLADVVTVDDKTQEETKESNGWLIRVKRKDEDTVRIFQFMQNSTQQYVLVLVVDICYRPTLQTRYIFKPTIRSEELNEVTIPLIFKSVGFVAGFKPIIKQQPPTSSSFRKKVKPKDTDKYIVYTLDLTQPIKRSGVSLGGTHASPIEHERRGHWRTYKSGKKVFVSAITVNKGKGGRVEKDYRL